MSGAQGDYSRRNRELETDWERTQHDSDRIRTRVEQMEREQTRRAAEDEHWGKQAAYFESQNSLVQTQSSLAQTKKACYEQKMRLEEAETAARIASQMNISLQGTISVLRGTQGSQQR
ncbi:hypothetical protein AYX15_06550 [Cryptococcus neoformans]|nr:hypothetical protein AYX15_06550 [Cryptococcus neoformans var. grubii]